MPVRVTKSVSAKLAAEETIAVSFEPQGAIAVEMLAAALALVRQVGDSESEYPGPSWVSEPMVTPDALVVLIDGSGTSRAQAREIVTIFEQHLDVDGVDLRVREAKGTGRFDRLSGAKPILALHFMSHYDSRLRTESELPRMAGGVLDPIRQIVPDPAPALFAGCFVPVDWEYLAQFGSAGHYYLTMAAEHEGLFVHVSLVWDGSGQIRLHGEPLRDPATLARCADGLRDAARALPAATPASIIRPNLTYRNAIGAVGPNPDGEALMRRIAARTGADDEYAVGVGWSQIVTAALWDKITSLGEVAGAEAVPLDGGRVEVTFGAPLDWADWEDPTSQPRADAYAAFAPVIVDHNQWLPVSVAVRAKVTEVLDGGG